MRTKGPTTDQRRRDLQDLRRMAILRHSLDPISPEYRTLLWLEEDLVERLRYGRSVVRSGS